MADRQLTPTQSKVVFGLMVALLAGGGIAWSLGVGAGGEDQAQQQPDRDPPPSPMPTSAPDAESVEEWFPYSRAEFAAAGDLAQRFASRYATADYEGDPEGTAYTEQLAALATEDYAERLEAGSGAAAMRADLAEEETSTTGRAQVAEVTRFSPTSITFTVEVQTITTDAEGAHDELGEYSATIVREDGEWRVYDFLPADVGQAGDPAGAQG